MARESVCVDKELVAQFGWGDMVVLMLLHGDLEFFLFFSEMGDRAEKRAS